MPGTAFGFGPYPPRPSVPPRVIGQALARQNAPQRPQDAPGSTISPRSLPDPTGGLLGLTPADPTAMAPGSMLETITTADGDYFGEELTFEQQMAETGRRRALGPGFAPDQTAVSVGRALGLPMGQQGTDPAPFSDEQLRRLGLPEMELRLLRTTGALR